VAAALDRLLDTLAAYPSTPDAACFTLPPEAYTDPDLHALEVERIFRREWLIVGRAGDVAQPGDWFTIDVLDEPLLIVRGTDGTVRALSNVCRHRYMPVALEEKGNAKRFVCAYHGWVYGTDGRLVAAPLMEGSTGFDKTRCNLPEYRLEQWQGFLFVNFDAQAAPLAPQLAEADARLESYRSAELVTGLAYDAIWEGNWKLATENGMEYYHHMGLHGRTLEAMLPAAGARMEAAPASGRFTHSRCPYADRAAAAERVARRHASRFSEDDATSSYAMGLFPNISLALTPDSNNWLSFLPMGPERTRVIGGYLLPDNLQYGDPETAAQRNALIHAVNEEDAQATWRLQQVMRSSKAVPGPLNLREGTIAQFYKYLARTLAPDRVAVMPVAAE
jgi:phenylpropionate dioxygenase-like ring-hydroxylating dioxygenase large terminal subunit